MKKKSFTLAEILIALTIIGIISAITVPLIFAAYQEQAIKSSLKKNYSVLKQALDKYQIDNGERLKASDGEAGTNIIKGKIINYFVSAYDCGKGTETAQSVKHACFSKYESATDVNYTNYNGTSTNINTAYFDDGQFVLNDGSLILIENNSSSKLYLSVDVNGFGKKPNRLGKDLFMFQLTEEGELLPMGAKGTDYYNAKDSYCSNTSTNNMNGAGCTYKMLN